MNRETTKLTKQDMLMNRQACQAYALYQPSFTADLRKDPSWVEALNESDWHKVQNVSKHHSPTGPTDAKFVRGVYDAFEVLPKLRCNETQGAYNEKVSRCLAPQCEANWN